jgi:fatty acid/phospholipid biosynthesis enzyme
MLEPGKGPIIGVDAMGGDLAPRVVIQGALEALRESSQSFEVALIGDEPQIRAEAGRLGVLDPNVCETSDSGRLDASRRARVILS